MNFGNPKHQQHTDKVIKHFSHIAICDCINQHNVVNAIAAADKTCTVYPLDSSNRTNCRQATTLIIDKIINVIKMS